MCIYICIYIYIYIYILDIQNSGLLVCYKMSFSKEFAYNCGSFRSPVRSNVPLCQTLNTYIYILKCAGVLHKL